MMSEADKANLIDHDNDEIEKGSASQNQTTGSSEVPMEEVPGGALFVGIDPHEVAPGTQSTSGSGGSHSNEATATQQQDTHQGPVQETGGQRQGYPEPARQGTDGQTQNQGPVQETDDQRTSAQGPAMQETVGNQQNHQGPAEETGVEALYRGEQPRYNEGERPQAAQPAQATGRAGQENQKMRNKARRDRRKQERKASKASTQPSVATSYVPSAAPASSAYGATPRVAPSGLSAVSDEDLQWMMRVAMELAERATRRRSLSPVPEPATQNYHQREPQGGGRGGRQGYRGYGDRGRGHGQGYRGRGRGSRGRGSYGHGGAHNRTEAPAPAAAPAAPAAPAPPANATLAGSSDAGVENSMARIRRLEQELAEARAAARAAQAARAVPPRNNRR